jgi:hypothetical protein
MSVRNRWTHETLQIEALKYESRGEFFRKSGSAYSIAHRKGLLSQICLHMVPKRENWTLEKVRKESQKYKTRNSFRKGSSGAHAAAQRMGILDELCRHMPQRVDQCGENNHNFKYSNEELVQEALRYKTRIEFRKKNSNAYACASKRKILSSICAHMKLLRRSAYTNEELHNEAIKYSTRSEFERENSGAYQVAHKRGVLDRICTHMVEARHVWKITELLPEALLYKTRTAFQKGSPGAWDVARRLDILDKICSHMPNSANASLSEIELFEIIKTMCPEAKKLRDRKVKIEGKPYIKGFDIDILVGNLGIEFDGPHHHSFEYMRKSYCKRFWSDEDIRNYHEIKDAWFATKGIEILHIKWDDWIADKRVCIDKRTAFLKGIPWL